MRLLQTLMLTIALCLLTACDGSIKPAEIDLAPPPQTHCVPPVLLPDRELSQAEVERLWLEDRFNLKACRDALDLLKDWIDLVIRAASGEDLLPP